MEKHTVHVDMKIHADAKEFLEKLLKAADKCGETYVSPADAWRKQCVAWKEKYPVVSESQLHTGDNKVNVYGFVCVEIVGSDFLSAFQFGFDFLYDCLCGLCD
jgi:acetolactate synthase-1/2/3 large subunit